MTLISVNRRELSLFVALGLRDGTRMQQLQGIALKPMPSLYVQLAPSYEVSDNVFLVKMNYWLGQ